MDHKIPNWDEGETNEEAQGASEVGHLKLFAKGIVNQLLVFLHFDLWQKNWNGKHVMFNLY